MLCSHAYGLPLVVLANFAVVLARFGQAMRLVQSQQPSSRGRVLELQVQKGAHGRLEKQQSDVVERYCYCICEDVVFIFVAARSKRILDQPQHEQGRIVGEQLGAILVVVDAEVGHDTQALRLSQHDATEAR